jgi:hypothetical protein
MYIPFSAEYNADGFDENSPARVLLQLRSDPDRPTALFEKKKYKLLEYEQLFAHINKTKRPDWDSENVKLVLTTLDRMIGVKLDEKAIMDLQHLRQEPPSLPVSSRSANWTSTGYNKAVETWKFHVTDKKMIELSTRSGCSPEKPLQTEIQGLKQAHEQFTTEAQYLDTVISLFGKFLPFTHDRQNLDLSSFRDRNLTVVVDRHMCIYYYFDFDDRWFWTTNLSCVIALYNSCAPKCDKRFFRLLGTRYDFRSEQPDTGASTYATYLLHTRPGFEPDDTPDENEAHAKTFLAAKKAEVVG